ncbi:hypothetical protein [Nocardiopsis gilva]|uniref:hypothetical protein n=1 Tax=Nocardiopsis gilva TaxID=280236 RepID=UPI00036D5E6C|nr:hypothetical protein [Nocardiopsis gilva]
MSGEQAERWADGVRAELVRTAEPQTPEQSAPNPETAVSAPRRPGKATARKRPPKGE